MSTTTLLPLAGKSARVRGAARSIVREIRKQLLAIEAPVDDDVAFLAQANQVKNGLAYIDAANVRCHGEPPPLVFIEPQLILEGDGPSHYTKRHKSYAKGRLVRP